MSKTPAIEKYLGRPCPHPECTNDRRRTWHNGSECPSEKAEK